MKAQALFTDKMAMESYVFTDPLPKRGYSTAGKPVVKPASFTIKNKIGMKRFSIGR